MYNDNDIKNICLDKYYNELILFSNNSINLKTINYSKNLFIIKKIIEKNDLKNINIDNYNLFEKLCSYGNYRMIKWLCIKYKFDNKIIFFNNDNILIINIFNNNFVEKYINYAIINNNLKMLKFGQIFDRKNFLSYLKNNIYTIPHNDTHIIKWIIRQDNVISLKKIYKNFNINYYFNLECMIPIKYISKKTKHMFLSYKINIFNEAKYKILLWLLLNTKISRYDIDLVSWCSKNSLIQKKIYELLYSIKGCIYLNLFDKNINYLRNTMFIKI
jgi:hypothetical protein